MVIACHTNHTYQNIYVAISDRGDFIVTLDPLSFIKNP